jgi:thiol-disulfide isomerase/thioredoxin
VPEVYVKEDVPFVEVRCNDGRYFIREIGSHLRVLREAEIDKGLFATDEVRGPEATLRGMSSSASMKMEAWDEANWFVVACGPRDDGWAVVVRLNPVDFSKRGYGFSGGGVGLTSAFHGNTQIVDDGELVVANRTLPAVYLFEKKREAARQAILSGKLPAIESAKWLNTDEPLDWDKLKGKVVLVDFWGTWCGPCVAKLPELQPLHEKYAERGLAIIAIHSANSADSCEEFIREHKFTFPVAIDSGTTAEEFAISAWPTYFLIDRAGTVVEGFNHATPTEEAIVKLIDSAVE